MCGFPCEGTGIIYILVEDAGGVSSALENAGLMVELERDVYLLEAEDRPGMLGEIMRKLANAGVNVDLLYKVAQAKMVVGADDLEKVQATL